MGIFCVTIRNGAAHGRVIVRNATDARQAEYVVRDSGYKIGPVETCEINEYGVRFCFDGAIDVAEWRKRKEEASEDARYAFERAGGF